MTLTGLFLVPLTPTSTSPLTSLLSHITFNFPCSPLPAYTVSYQLFASTSSLLPDAQSKIPRQYCQLLTTSHSPETTFVGTTSSKPNTVLSVDRDLNQIAIPLSSADNFAQLLNSKLQPLWAHRQNLTLESGTSISLRNGEFSLRVGELKQAARIATAPTALRGILFEVTHEDGNGATGTSGSDQDEITLRGFLDRLLEGTGVKLDDALLASRYTGPIPETSNLSESDISDRNWALSDLYMETLRATRQ